MITKQCETLLHVSNRFSVNLQRSKYFDIYSDTCGQHRLVCRLATRASGRVWTGVSRRKWSIEGWEMKQPSNPNRYLT